MAGKNNGCYLTWTTKAGENKFLRFDLVLSETHKLTATATEHPVEKGANVTDHIRSELDAIDLSVFVTNTPIHNENLLKVFGDTRGSVQSSSLEVELYEAPLEPTPGSLFNAVGGALSTLLEGKKEYNSLTLKFPTEFNSVSETLKILREVKETGQLVNIITPMWDYSNMALLSIDLPRTPGDGDAGKFSLSFKALRIVSTKQVANPIPTEPRGKQAVSKGAKGPNPATKTKSVAKAAIDAVVGQLGGLLKSPGPAVPGVPGL